MTLTKAITLEYMASVTRPVTGKELSIDLDSRASTAPELLERMTAQGLCARDAKQRPREYAMTDAGRERLAWFRAQDCAGPESGRNRGELDPLPVMPKVNGSTALTLREV